LPRRLSPHNFPPTAVILAKSESPYLRSNHLYTFATFLYDFFLRTSIV